MMLTQKIGVVALAAGAVVAFYLMNLKGEFVTVFCADQTGDRLAIQLCKLIG